MKMLTALPLLALALNLHAADAPAPKFRAVDIDTNVEIGYGIAIADVDGDGKPDIILADKKTVQWYRNPKWEKFIIAENLTEKDNVCVAARDINGDGKAEIAVGAGWNPGDTENSGAVFYLLPPADRTQKWTPVALHHEPTVHRMHWALNPAGKWDLIVKPLHGRGNKNNEGVGGKVLAYSMPANPRDEWKTTVVSDFMHATHNFQPINWDNDPEHELLIGGKEGVWFFGQSTGAWKHRQFTDQPAGEVRDGQLASGTRFFATIEPMHGTTVCVYSDPGKKGLWNRRVLDDTLKDGHALAVGDVLGLGSPQVVAGWRGMTPKGVPGVKIYVPNNDGSDWRQVQISGAEVAIEDLKMADLNGGGKLDLILAGRQTKNLRILWNEK
ncbi:MAG: VCBS repeat-containing protein [Verrucomicrobia bacterium]|nr:VCBS repeat-containing protein [Verrucomicrobiota bacterium]